MAWSWCKGVLSCTSLLRALTQCYFEQTYLHVMGSYMKENLARPQFHMLFSLTGARIFVQFCHLHSNIIFAKNDKKRYLVIINKEKN